MAVTGMPLARPVGLGPRAEAGDPPRIVYEGLVGAVIGYGVLALLIALWSWSRGHSPLYDGALLGANLFFGATPAPDAPIEPAHLLAYNGAHLVVFVLFGFALAWLAGVAERIPQGWYLLGVGFLFVVVHVAALPVWFDERVLAELPAGVMALATALSFLAMAVWLLREHPGLRAGAHEPD